MQGTLASSPLALDTHQPTGPIARGTPSARLSVQTQSAGVFRITRRLDSWLKTASPRRCHALNLIQPNISCWSSKLVRTRRGRHHATERRRRAVPHNLLGSLYRSGLLDIACAARIIGTNASDIDTDVPGATAANGAKASDNHSVMWGARGVGAGAGETRYAAVSARQLHVAWVDQHPARCSRSIRNLRPTHRRTSSTTSGVQSDPSKHLRARTGAFRRRFKLCPGATAHRRASRHQVWGSCSPARVLFLARPWPAGSTPAASWRPGRCIKRKVRALQPPAPSTSHLFPPAFACPLLYDRSPVDTMSGITVPRRSPSKPNRSIVAMTVDLWFN